MRSSSPVASAFLLRGWGWPRFFNIPFTRILRRSPFFTPRVPGRLCVFRRRIPIATMRSTCAPLLTTSASMLTTAIGATTASLLRRVFMMTVFFLAIGFFQGFQADLANQVDEPGFRLLGLAGADLHRIEGLRRHILHIHLSYLPHPLDRQRILLVAVRQDIPH